MEELWGGGVVWWRSCVVEELRSYGVKPNAMVALSILSPFRHWELWGGGVMGWRSCVVEELCGGGVKELWS